MKNISVISTQAIGQQANRLFDSAFDSLAVTQLFERLAQHNERTARHCYGVGLLAAAFALELGMHREEAIKTVRAAILHDVGKLEISNITLDKPGALASGERSIINHHPVDGYAIVASALDADTALPILFHHRLQVDYYPNDTQLNSILGKDSLQLLTIPQSTWLSVICIAAADNYESRLPVAHNTHPYNRRDYSVAEERNMIWNDYVAAGYIQELGLLDEFRQLLDLGEAISERSVADDTYAGLPVSQPMSSFSRRLSR